MKYALLLYADREFERQWDAMGDEERAQVYAQFSAFDEAAVKAGATLLGGNELGLSHTATTLRRPVDAANRDSDEVTITDGPFAEVAEHLGGYYEIEARDLDHAIEVAKLLPSSITEIRPIVEPGGTG